MDSVPVESGEETGPFGLKGAGEIAMDGPLPAVANAVALVGPVIRWCELPNNDPMMLGTMAV